MSDRHPFYRPENRRRLKFIGLVLAVLSLLAELFVSMHGHFGFDDVFGFNAVSGLIGTAGLIVVAFIAFLILQREDDYYDAD